MQNYTTTKIMEGFYSIEEGFVRCFLIEGHKEALLVDTGVGSGDLKKYVEGITKLPVTVIFTHADGDHTANAGQFEKRLMHPSEFDYYKSRNEKAVSMEPVWEGDIIDFGSYRFEVILIPGHTPGSIVLLEREKRFLIGGDSIQCGSIFMFGNGRNFEAYRASMKKLQGRLKEFDTVYASHNELSVEADTINTLYTAAGKVMENQVSGRPEERFDGKVKCYETDGVSFYAV
ncbi:MAG: MBL fold metallo-hydrolase [Bacillota bacterium]|nr:MBL fold metallo-hydrolase [Bacillota bacterium]